MKTCKINLEKRNELFRNLGLAIVVAAVLSLMVEDKISIVEFSAMIVFGLIFAVLGVCGNDD